MILPIISKTLVEASILFFSNFLSLFHPNGLVDIELLELSRNFFYFLFLLVFLVFLDLDIFFLLVFFLFIIRNFFLGGLFDLEGNRE
jgi:hypothetical protein